MMQETFKECCIGNLGPLESHGQIRSSICIRTKPLILTLDCDTSVSSVRAAIQDAIVTKETVCFRTCFCNILPRLVSFVFLGGRG